MTELAPILLAVLGASLLGSLHCLGMCGGFVTVIAGASREPGPRGPQSSRGLRIQGPVLAYQGTRGLAYIGLGALAGLLGAGLDASASFVGLQRIAGPLMGVTLIVMALASVWPSSWPGTGAPETDGLVRLRAGDRKGPRRSLLARLRLRLGEAVRTRGAAAGAAAGLLTAVLPCGWLWAYVAVAAGTGQAGAGALVMAAFWLGNVPALLGLGLAAGELARRLGRHAPRITAALMLGLGILSLVGKLQVPVAGPSEAEDAANQDHAGQAATPVPTSAPCH